uniref:Uncharacterized protein n=1 Tax=Trichogramma kaykai TaxID=54128 RepID=A0ABD2XRC5_9HYME
MAKVRSITDSPCSSTNVGSEPGFSRRTTKVARAFSSALPLGFVSLLPHSVAQALKSPATRCFSSGLVNNVVQQADEFLVEESRRRIDAEDINSSNLRPGVEVTLPRGAQLHRHSTAHPDCRLVVGIRDPDIRWCEGPVLVGQDCHINLQLPHRLQDQVLGGLSVVEVELEDANPLLRHFAPRTNSLASGQPLLNEAWVLASSP